MKAVRSLITLVLVLVSVQGFASTCVFPPGSASPQVCTLPPMDANQCAEYHFQWAFHGGSTILSLSLGSSQVIAPTVLATDGSAQNTFEIRGKVCNAGAVDQQFPLTGPVIRDTQIIAGPGLGVQTAEDTSYGSTLTFSVIGQRGFGSPAFLGGTVDVR